MVSGILCSWETTSHLKPWTYSVPKLHLLETSQDSTYKILIPSTLKKKERAFKSMCGELDRKERWIHPCNQKSSRTAVRSTKTKSQECQWVLCFFSKQVMVHFNQLQRSFLKGQNDKLVFIHLSSASAQNNLAEEVISGGKQQ